MKTLHLCTIYETRPDWCRQYPWNSANEIFEDCQFYDKESKKLRTHEEQLELNSEEEIEQFCNECGKCCFYWECGQKIHACSALRITQVPEETS